PKTAFFRPHFGAFYPHPAHKSALRAEAATHCLTPGKPGWVGPQHPPGHCSHAPCLTLHARPAGSGRARTSPPGYCHPPTGRVAGRYCYLPAPSELDVRVAPHPAQAFTDAPCGTRSLLSVFLARGSADDSWRVVSPCYPPFQDRLGYAKSDDGSDSRPLLSAAVDHRPHIVPLVSSRDIPSDCNLSASGSVANPTVPPGTVPTSDRRD